MPDTIIDDLSVILIQKSKKSCFTKQYSSDLRYLLLDIEFLLINFNVINLFKIINKIVTVLFYTFDTKPILNISTYVS